MTYGTLSPYPHLLHRGHEDFQKEDTMKTTFFWTGFLVILSFGFAFAEENQTRDRTCQKYAQDFAENSDALNEMQLKQLQFCITQTLEQRYKTNPPDLLKGTIIEPPSFSNEVPGTPPPSSPNSGAQ
jgi:hypothetical protein